MKDNEFFEPLVAGEQGVVYLFSRYLKDIPEFEKVIQEIEKIQTRFPDLLFRDKSNKICGLEFELNLSKFKKHYPTVNAFLKDYPQQQNDFWIVYWNEDCCKEEIKNKLKAYGIKKTRFLKLSDYFEPIVIMRDDLIFPLLTFKDRMKHIPPFDDIFKDLKKLKKKKLVNLIKGKTGVIRISGYNPKFANEISLKHWSFMNFYTTTSPLWSDKMASEIFVLRDKDNLLIMKSLTLFEFTKRNHPEIKKFFRKYYFYERLGSWSDFKQPYCVIYTKCKFIHSQKGFIEKVVKYHAKKGKKKFNQNGYTYKPTDKHYKEISSYLEGLISPKGRS